MTPFKRLAPLGLVFSLVFFVAACGGDGSSSTTEAIEFGEGEIPDSVPDDFPVPSNAVVGNTLVDHLNNKTEFRLTIRSDLDSAVQFFSVGLVNRGYVVEQSSGGAATWELTFDKGPDLRGTIVFTAPQPDLVVAVVTLSVS